MREGLPVGHGLTAAVLDNPALMPRANNSAFLTDIQYTALEYGIARSESAIVSAPTSTGKTLIGLWTIAASIVEGGRAVYLVSHRALARQKFDELQAVFGRTILTDPATLVLATGDGVEDAAGRRITNPLESSVLVATYEKFLNCLAVSGPPRDLSDLCLVCDEIQLISEEGRGSHVELLLTLLKRSGWKQFVGLSAVLSERDAADLSAWLNVGHLRNPNREKALRIECRTPTGVLVTTADPDFGMEPVHEVAQRLPRETLQIVREMMQHEGRRPIIVFCMRIDDTYSLAQNWVAATPAREQVLRPPGAEVSADLLHALSCRAAYHNAELTEDERELVEARLKDGHVDVVFSTATLAAGVNFPLGSAVFHAWKRYNFARRVAVPIERAEFQNMAGRVGRMGQVASQGLVTLTAETPGDQQAVSRLMDLEAQDELISRIGPGDFGQLLLHIFAGGLCDSRDAAYEIIAGTLSASRELDRNRAGLAGWRERVDAEIDELVEQECLLEGRRLVPTLFGVCVAKTGLKPATANWFLSELFQRSEYLRTLLPSASRPGDEEALAFILSHAAATSPEYDFSAGRPSRFFHWRLRNQLAPNPSARQLADVLFSQPWNASVEGANAALLTSAWASGRPRADIERLVPNVRLGTITNQARDISWILIGISEIIGRVTAPSLDESVLPTALQGDVEKLASLRLLARPIRRQAQRIGTGLGSEVVWMSGLELVGLRPRLTRSEIVALQQAGLTTPMLLMRGDAAADEARQAALASVGTSDRGASSRLREAAKSWRVKDRVHCKRLHERRTAAVDGGDLVNRLYTVRGTDLEAVLVEAFEKVGHPLTVIDDGTHPGRPDFLWELDELPPIVIEVKTKMADDQSVGLSSATEVLAASELMGMAGVNCLTICSPGVDPSVPRLIEESGRLCVVDISDLTDAIVRMLRGELAVDAMHNWLTTPGVAAMGDLIGRDY